MQKGCKKCSVVFTITESDQAFYNKMFVPEPTFCPDCRQQRRIAFRNERNLYQRKCDMSGRDIVSNYSPNKPYKVFGYDEWWGDNWDPLNYGFEFDFNKPFFEQFSKLLLSVPRLYLYNPHSENSEYTNHCYYNKNCYLIFNAAYNEDVYYSTNLIVKCRDSSDCMTAEDGELLYWALYVTNCHNSKFLVHSSSCRDSAFLYDCKNCANCFMCSNLRNKEYYIENKPYSKEEYEAKIKEHELGKHSELQDLKKRFIEFVKDHAIHKNLHVEHAENARGDYIFNSKNVFWTFFADKCEDIAYCFDALNNKDCMDTYESSINCELQYECYACNESSVMKFCVLCHFSHNLEYCDYCFNCKDCFGCTGLKKKQYCIFNKQYSKEEYEKVRSQIIEHMKKDEEYGEFFPISLSPFGYNESVAQEYYPVTKEEAQAAQYKWKRTNKAENQPSNYTIPDDIKDVPGTITNELLFCESCSKNYKIIPQELNLYKKLSIPVPRKCFNCRHEERVKNFRNPRKLWNQNCGKCKESILTSYPPESVRNIYCENCYLGEVY